MENEYGSYDACDRNYTSWLRDVLRSHVTDNAVLFTTDGNDSGYLKCGPIPGVFTTVDFGCGTTILLRKNLLISNNRKTNSDGLIPGVKSQDEFQNKARVKLPYGTSKWHSRHSVQSDKAEPTYQMFDITHRFNTL